MNRLDWLLWSTGVIVWGFTGAAIVSMACGWAWARVKAERQNRKWAAQRERARQHQQEQTEDAIRALLKGVGGAMPISEE